jgi:archaellum component FlaC
MVKDLVKLVEILNNKINPLVEAIENEAPTTKEYGQLIDNYAGTMQLISTLNRTLAEITMQAMAKEEGAKDESNN